MEDATAERERWVEAMLASLTLEEKVTLLAGRDAWTTPPIERTGVPSIKVTDGPNGARGGGFGAVTAACFPVGSALAASWSTDVLNAVGGALAEEAISKGAQVLLGPTVNLHRSPLAGRNFECYSEDPYLSAALAVAYVSGLQAKGVGACIKHFVANDSEFERMTISSVVDERTLRELYLVPFEAAVAEAKPWAVMAAYNRINGTFACEHAGLLLGVLKDEWGFDGVVISDWGAVHATVDTAAGGTDLEMPGPAVHLGDRLVDAVRCGEVEGARVEDMARRMLRLVHRSGRLDHPDDPPEAATDRPEHRALARRAAAEGMVLLQNRRLGQVGAPALPLVLGDDLKKIAVIGPNAEVGVFQGGGSSIVRAHYVVHPLEAIIERAGPTVEVLHESGGTIERYQPEPDTTWFTPIDDDGRHFRIEYFDSADLSGGVVATRNVRGVSWVWWRNPPLEITDRTRFSARWTAGFVPAVSGSWRLGLAALGRSRVRVDGIEVLDNWTNPRPGELFFGAGSVEEIVDIEVVAGQEHELVVEYACTDSRAAIRFGMSAPVTGDPIAEAVAAAADADAAVVIVGTNADWETEGSDRPTMRLPGAQDRLVAEVAAAGRRTIVVLNTGSPVEMPWADDVQAIVQAWFPGQEFGRALADVLFGDADPGGRLPTTFPRRYEDHPALFNYPGEAGAVRYGEGVFTGYRGYDQRGVAPRFPFGHGLSYTTFALGEPVLTHLVGDLTTVSPAWRGPVLGEVAIDVTNTGDRAGHEVVQLFVRPCPSHLTRPPLELKGFAKLSLDPGTTGTARFTLDARTFAAFDPTVRAWVASVGDHELVIATAGKPRVAVPFRLADTIALAL